MSTTTTVRKGAGRKAAQAKTTRAAQRPCYYKGKGSSRPYCEGIATVKVGRFLLCDSCNSLRSTVGKGEPVKRVSPAATTGTRPKARGRVKATAAKSSEPTITRNVAHREYRRARKALAGSGGESYRKAAAKALGVTDTAFTAAFYAKATS